jgi:hypothetical protein
MADNIPIMVEKDEYVVNNNATSNPFVRKLLDLINFDMFPKSPDRNSIMGDHVRQGYSHGGPAEDHTISYGDYDVPFPDKTSLYDQFNYQPKDKYKDMFQDYDIGREQPYREDYGLQVGQLGKKYQTGIGAATEKSMSLGRGFTGFGQREYGMGQARKSMLGDYLSGKQQAYSTMFKGIRGERDQYLRDTASNLKWLESIGGTTQWNENQDIPPQYAVPQNHADWKPPVASSEGDVYTFQGVQYYFTGASWVTAAEWNEMQADKQLQDFDYGP